MKIESIATVTQLDEFDDIVDVRSPSEFYDDSVPAALNCPVLNDEERAQVGTIYKQQSPFLAKKLGATLIARNIAHHIEQHFADKPKSWQPLVYCWRGGQRSRAMAYVLGQIGWKCARLDGGYKAFRRTVLSTLPYFPEKLRFSVVCGETGSGKSRLLNALVQCGAQVLDLEGLAAHRGSVLGNLPYADQPTQKRFESRLWDVLRKFNASRPVFVEAESKRIGNVSVPQALLERMWQAECIKLNTHDDIRVQLLKQDYRHLIENSALLFAKLAHLKTFFGREKLLHWQRLGESNEWDKLVQQLLIEHYDKAYHRSTVNHYAHYATATQYAVQQGDETEFKAVAEDLLRVTEKTTATAL